VKMHRNRDSGENRKELNRSATSSPTKLPKDFWTNASGSMFIGFLTMNMLLNAECKKDMALDGVLTANLEGSWNRKWKKDMTENGATNRV